MEQYISILKLSCLWDADTGCKYATEGLAALSLRPAQRFYFGRQFRQKAWVERAISDLMNTPNRDVTAEDRVNRRRGASTHSASARDFGGENQNGRGCSTSD